MTENSSSNIISQNNKAYASTIAAVGGNISATQNNLAEKNKDKIQSEHLFEKTKGEEIFNHGTYWGIGWIANSIISMFTADKINHGSLQVPMFGVAKKITNFTGAESWTTDEFLQAREMTNHLQKGEYKKDWLESQKIHGKDTGKFYERIGKPTEELLEKLKNNNILKSEGKEALEKEFSNLAKASHAYNSKAKWLSFAALQVGGWLTMIPIKILEDHKLEITKKIDKNLLDNNATEEEKYKIEQRHEQIKHEPKQSWLSEFGSRAVAQPLILGFYFITSGYKNILSMAGIKFDGTDAIMERNIDKMFPEHPKENSLFKNITDRLDKEPSLLEKKYLDAGVKGFERHSGVSRFKSSIAFNGLLELTYAGIIATGVFIASRILGPYFATKSHQLDNQPEKKDSKEEQIISTLENDINNNIYNKNKTPSAKIISTSVKKHDAISPIDNTKSANHSEI